MDRNIIMAIITVALLATIFIAISVLRKGSPCPEDVNINTAQKIYEIGESVRFSVAAPDGFPEISTYEWRTENGQISKQPATDFTFNTAGQQKISVTINQGCVYNYILEIKDTVEVDDVVENIVAGEISASKNTICPTDWIEFEDNTQSASAWWWDFGDANTSPLQNPRHSYKNPGTYIVKRMLNGESNLVSTLTITVKNCNKPAVSNPNITAKFTMNNPSPRANEDVQFNDQTPNATKWLWNFGDGYTSQERSPSHVYNFAGNYIVMLSVGSTGKNVTTKTINVAPSLAAPPPIAPSTVQPPPTVVINPATSPAPVSSSRPMDLASTLQSKFQEIATSNNDELKTNIYYNDLLPKVADENMIVKVMKNGQQTEDSFYDYYNSLNIQGGQRITRVEVLNTNAAGRATALRITEQ